MRPLIPLLLTSIVLQPLAWGQSDELDADQPRWFQIELLLFRNLSAAAQQQEHWPEEIDIWLPEPSYQMPAPGSPGNTARSLETWEAPELHLDRVADEGWPGQAPQQAEIAEPEPEQPQSDTEADAETDGLLQYRGVPASDSHLGDIKNRLERRSDYQVLDYRAWRQPLVNDGDPVYFRVEAGQSHEFYRELEGYIGFYLKRYLHVDTELWWGEYPAQTDTVDSAAIAISDQPQIGAGEDLDASEMAVSSQPESFNHRRVVRAAHLKEQRRMRSDEVHYFDHPLIGVLVRISPWEGPID